MITDFFTTALTHPLVTATALRLTDDYDYASDEGGAWFWLLGPAGGIGFYMWVFLRYRNTNKRHAYEHESATELRNLRTHDKLVDRISGTSESSIRGRNSQRPLERLGAGTTVTVLPAPKPPVQEVIDNAQNLTAPATETPGPAAPATQPPATGGIPPASA